MANKYAELFKQSGIRKRLLVSFPSLSLTLRDEDIVAESMEISESICSEAELRFGACESSIFKLRIIGNVVPLIGETCTVSMYVGDIAEPYVLGTYKVASDKPTADRNYRDIVAYDAMYDIINADVAEWYNTLLPAANSTTTLGAFRSSFVSHFGIEEEAVTLANDDMVVTKTVQLSKLSGKAVFSAICELNGCFPHIGRNGKMQYIILKEFIDGLLPENTLFPSDSVFPYDGNTEKLAPYRYISCKYEDYATQRIGKLQIRQEENDIGCIIGDGNNGYIMEGNFLVYGKDADELAEIAQKVFDVIRDIWFRPATTKAIGNPCFEVGTGIRIVAQQGIIETYILERTIKGIQGLIDTYGASGNETYWDNVNSLQKSIIQLQGKTNILIRNVNETISRIESVNENLSSEIKQTADQISTKVSKGEVISEINQTAETVKISASKIDLTGYVTINDLSGTGTTSINGANIQTGTIRADSISNVGVLTVSNISCGSSFECTNSLGTAEASFDKVSARSIYSNFANFNFYNNNLVGLCSFSFVDANGTTHDVSFIGTHSESVG